MEKINRRSFLTKAAVGTGATLALTQLPGTILAAANANDMPIGFQSWTVKEMLSKDFEGTLKVMAGMGYKMIEMCSPKGYAQIGFGKFAAMKTADIKLPSIMRASPVQAAILDLQNLPMIRSMKPFSSQRN